MSALHYAIKQGDANAVSLLIANGADVNSKDGQFIALTRAAMFNQFEIAQILLSLGADVNLIVGGGGGDSTRTCALNYAAEFGSADLITLLIANGALLDRIYPGDQTPYPITPLHTAAKAGNYDAVVALVNCGAKINGNVPNNVASDTPLAWAVENLKYSNNPQNLELVKFLVSHGATRYNRKYHDQQYNSNICPVISGYLQSVGK